MHSRMDANGSNRAPKHSAHHAAIAGTSYRHMESGVPNNTYHEYTNGGGTTVIRVNSHPHDYWPTMMMTNGQSRRSQQQQMPPQQQHMLHHNHSAPQALNYVARNLTSQQQQHIAAARHSFDAMMMHSQANNHHHHRGHSPVIWTVEHAKPTIIVRKPRKKRVLRSLFCCFGAQASSGGDASTSGGSNSANGENGGIAGHDMVDAAVRLPMHTVPYSPKPSEKVLLPPLRPCDINKKCLIIDLDETLVHSSFKPVKNPDFVIPVEIEGVIHQVYVMKRPHVDEFLQRIAGNYECILFTASLAKYADPVADLLDKWSVFRARLFREACVLHNGSYVKDLARLGRDLKRIIIVDNSPASYAFHPDNALPVSSWFDDPRDTELMDIMPALDRLAVCENVFPVLAQCADAQRTHLSHLPPVHQVPSSEPISSVITQVER